MIPDGVGEHRVGPDVASAARTRRGAQRRRWTFGKCSLGVPIATSIGADSPGWTFTTQSGDPVVSARRGAPGSAPGGRGAAPAAPRGPTPARPRAARRARAAAVRRPGPRAARGCGCAARASRVERTLFEHGRREELARTSSGRRLRPFALRHIRGGLFVSPRARRAAGDAGAAAPGRARRRAARPAAGRGSTPATSARSARVVPAGVSRAGRRARARDAPATARRRARPGGITLRQRWRCVRDRKGEFAGIRPIAPRRPTAASRPGRAPPTPRGARPGAARPSSSPSPTAARAPRPCRLLALAPAGDRTAGGRPQTTASGSCAPAGRARCASRCPCPPTPGRRACVRSPPAPTALAARARGAARAHRGPRAEGQAAEGAMARPGREHRVVGHGRESLPPTRGHDRREVATRRVAQGGR